MLVHQKEFPLPAPPSPPYQFALILVVVLDGVILPLAHTHAYPYP